MPPAKIGVGAVMSELTNPPAPMAVRGKELLRGLPVTRTVDHLEIASVLEKSISAIELGIIQTLETCPPELASDIYVNGVYVTGGNALLRAFDVETLVAGGNLVFDLGANEFGVVEPFGVTASAPLVALPPTV